MKLHIFCSLKHEVVQAFSSNNKSTKMLFHFDFLQRITR